MLPAFFMFTTNGIPALQEQKAGDMQPKNLSYQVLVRFLPLKAGLAGRAGFSG